MAAKITIIRQSHQSALDAGGTIRRLVRVDFKIGDDGPFSVSIPETDYSAAAAQDRIEQFAREVGQLRSNLEK